MADKKTILEEALLDAKRIKEALDANTKEILRSVAREEIDSVVKESLMEVDDEYNEEDVTTDSTTDDMDTPVPDMGSEGGDDLGGIETSMADATDISAEVGPETGDQGLGMDADALSGDIDMTAASDDDVIAIYKKLSGEDEIEIVGDDIHLNITEPGEYFIKTNETGGAPEPAMGGAEFGDDLEEIPTGGEADADDLEEIPTGGEESSDVEYNIAMDDETPEAGAEEETPEEELDEQIATNRVAQNRAGGNLTTIKGPGAQQGVKNESVKTKANLLTEAEVKYTRLLTETKALKAENAGFKEALKAFRKQLVESVVFNSNLTYTVRLLSEHSTTKAEKESILKRFDSEVTNLLESKKLYHTIANELSARKSITETVGNKIIKEVATGTSRQLNEATAYVDPSTQRIKDLIKRVESR